MAPNPGRRTQQDAQTQAYSHGRTGSLCHSTDNKPLDVENIIYLEELRRMALEWVTSIDTELHRIEAKRKRREEGDHA